MPVLIASSRAGRSRRAGSCRALGLLSSVALGAALLLPGAPAQGVGAAGGAQGAPTSTQVATAAVATPANPSKPSKPTVLPVPTARPVPTVLDDAVVVRWASKSTTQQRANLLTHAGLETLSTLFTAARYAPGLVDVSVVPTSNPAEALRALSGASGVVWAEQIGRAHV